MQDGPLLLGRRPWHAGSGGWICGGRHRRRSIDGKRGAEDAVARIRDGDGRGGGGVTMGRIWVVARGRKQRWRGGWITSGVVARR